MKLAKVTDLTELLNKHLSVEDSFNWGSFCPVICYKGVELWRTADDLKDVDIFVYDGSKDEDDYCLMCQDSYEDLYTYGSWKSLSEVRQWLENPKVLY